DPGPAAILGRGHGRGTTRGVAVVTGGNRGIGLEVGRQLVELGYHVVLGARDLDKGEAAARKIGAVACRLDVADEGSVREAARWIEEAFGRCDALVNNAAIHYDTWQRASSADL